MRKFALGGALIAFAISPAEAADPPDYQHYYPQEPIRGSYDWTGGYVGLHGGYGWGQVEDAGSGSGGGGGLGIGGSSGLLGGLLGGGDGLLSGVLSGGGGGGGGGLIEAVDGLLCGLVGIGLGGCSSSGGSAAIDLSGVIPGVTGTLDDLIGGIVGVDGFATSEIRGSSDLDGFFGGGQIGYNFQKGRMVLGLEGDLSVTGMTQESSFAASEGGVDISVLPGLVGLDAGVGTYEVAGSVSTDLDFLGTIRGRAGFAMDRVLLFGTGGVAFGQVDIDAFTTSTLTLAELEVGGSPLADISLSSSAFGGGTQMMVGYTLGAGVEYALSDTLTAKVEYAYVNLGEAAVRMSDGSEVKLDVDMHLVKAGANVRF